MKPLCDGCGHTFTLRLAVGEIYLPHFVHGINDIPVLSHHVHTYHIACRCFARLLFISVFLTFRLVECTAGFTGDKFKSSKGDSYRVDVGEIYPPHLDHGIIKSKFHFILTFVSVHTHICMSLFRLLVVFCLVFSSGFGCWKALPVSPATSSKVQKVTVTGWVVDPVYFILLDSR